MPHAVLTSFQLHSGDWLDTILVRNQLVDGSQTIVVAVCLNLKMLQSQPCHSGMMGYYDIFTLCYADKALAEFYII